MKRQDLRIGFKLKSRTNQTYDRLFWCLSFLNLLAFDELHPWLEILTLLESRLLLNGILKYPHLLIKSDSLELL